MPFPINFKPKHSYKLIRLGNDCDGGYLVDEESVMKSKLLIGMGISTDWSFEKDFRKHQPVLTHCYDHTLTIGFFIMHTIKSFLMIFQGRIKNFFLCLKFLIDYQLFFQGSVRHFREKIGCDNERAISINNALSRASTIDQESVFIKMDIERSEYRILDELIYNANSLSGLVIEFHDVDLHIKRISDFISEFPLELIHAHANNNWGVGLDNNTQLLELTFSKYSTTITQQSKLPHTLDRINNPELPEVTLAFD